MELCMPMDPYNAIGQAVEVVMTSFSAVYSTYQSEYHFRLLDGNLKISYCEQTSDRYAIYP